LVVAFSFFFGGGGVSCRGYSPTKASGYPAGESAAVGCRTATRCVQ
jgi:hypothetical protein